MWLWLEVADAVQDAGWSASRILEIVGARCFETFLEVVAPPREALCNGHYIDVTVVGG